MTYFRVPLLCCLSLTLSCLLMPAVVYGDGAAQPAGPWVSNTHSSGQRPIEVARIGTGGTYVLIMGSIYGNEPESVEIVDAAARLARNSQVPSDLTLLFIKTPNPDGQVELIRTNSNGVDLNRNFPTQWFTAKPNRLTGPHPASEIEIQYLLRIFQDFPLARVVHVRSAVQPLERPYAVTNEKWPASRPGEAGQILPLMPFAGEHKAGSLDEFVTLQLQAAMATVHLPSGKSAALSPADLLRFAAGTVRTNSQPDMLAGTQSSPSNGVTSHYAGAKSQPPGDGVKGNVDFLPPPPDLVSMKRGTVDERYYELPPPPRQN